MEKGDCKIFGHRENKRFRRRFGVSWGRFTLIVERAKTMRIVRDGPSPKTFGDIGNSATGVPCVPLELKILGWLRIDAKGCAFDAIAELTGMSLPTMQAFYHSFAERFVEEEKAEWIKYPRTYEDLRPSLVAYSVVGITGAVSSTDCVHVGWDRTPHGFKPNYVGKEKFSTVSYEVSCNRNKQILHVSQGHPGARNDLTIMKTDTYIQALCNGDLYDDITFELLDSHGEVVVVSKPFTITDNGYPKLRGLQCPIKTCTTMPEVAYSERAESVRKDIEGCFGILKVRFRILRSRILFQTQHKVDVCFTACCVKHNMNLVDDGLDKVWTEDSTWEIADDEVDENDIAQGLESLRVRDGGKALRNGEFVEGGGPPDRDIHEGELDSASHLKLRSALVVNFIRLKELGRVVWGGTSHQPTNSKW